MNALTNRHKRYLMRFHRNRKRWEAHSKMPDIHRMRQIEGAIIGLFVYFGVLNHWSMSLLSPTISWDTAFSVFTALFILYSIRELYWIHRSINYMIDCRAKNISELELLDTHAIARSSTVGDR